MGVNNEFPTLEGISPSFADISLKLTPKGAPVLTTIDFKDITTGRKVTVGEKQGASGGRVMSRTTGEVKNTCTITWYREGYLTLIERLVSVAPRRGNQALVSLVHFGIQIQHTPPGSTRIFDRRLKGVRLTSDDMKSAEGTDADTVTTEVSVIEIVDMVGGVEMVLL